jgi:EpsI family protein
MSTVWGGPSRRLLVIAGCMAATAAWLTGAVSADLVPQARLDQLPLTLDDWRGRDDGRLDAETEAVLQADSYLLRTYASGSTAVNLFVAYYATQRSGHAIHSPLNCLPGTGWEWTDRARQRVTVASDQNIDVNRNVARRHDQEVLVYYWYQSRGRTVASEVRNKMFLVFDALTLGRSDGALVRITTPLAPGRAAPSDEGLAFVRALYPTLTQHLPEL